MVTEPSAQSASPLQPAKIDPAAAVAVRATALPLLKVAEQVLPQLIPAGELVTVPLPVPALIIERAKLWRGVLASPHISFEYGELPAVLNAYTR